MRPDKGVKMASVRRLRRSNGRSSSGKCRGFGGGVAQDQFADVGGDKRLRSFGVQRELKAVQGQMLDLVRQDDGAKIVLCEAEADIFENKVFDVARIDTPSRQWPGINARTFDGEFGLLGFAAAAEFDVGVAKDDVGDRRIRPTFDGQRGAINARGV